MLMDRASDLALLPIEIAKNEPKFERAGIQPRRFLQVLDRQIHLAGHEMVQAEDEVRRLPDLAAIDPTAFLKFVPFPGLAAGQPQQERKQNAEKYGVVLHSRQS